MKDSRKTQGGNPPVTWDPGIAGIRLDSLSRSPYQVRAEGDEDLRALADDMAANGIVQPITVRRRGEGGYEIIAGHRRAAAARMLGWATIRAQVVEADDDAAERMLVAENFARRDLTPIEMADTAGALVERHGAAEAARICGKSERWAQRMAYISGRLSEDWRRVARAYGLSQASLEVLCKGTPMSQQDTLNEILDDWGEGDAPATVDQLCMMAKGTEIPEELKDGGTPYDLLANSNGETIADLPWQACGCGDCDGCKDRSDAIPEIAFDEDDWRPESPMCYGKRCRRSKMKEWLAGRGIEEWSKKLGRAVRPMPKDLAYWCGSSEENAKQTVPVMLRDYPAGGIKWFSEEQLAPKKQKKKEEARRWPTPAELRDTAFCETVMAELDQWKPTTAELMRLAIAMVFECPISGKMEWPASKRLPLAKALSAADVELAILDAVKNQIKLRAFTPSPGQFGPVQAQLDFWNELARFMARSDAALSAWKDMANALAEQRIADVNEAKKAEKKAGKGKARK